MDKNLEAAITEYRQNNECARALKKLIDDNFDGYRLDSNKVLSAAMNVFGEKRVELALASSIDQLSYDGRISTQNKNWAHGIMVAQDERNREIRIDGHPGLLDTLTGDFRKLQKSLAERTQQQNEAENKEPIITVSGQSGTNNSFDVTSVGFDTEKQYTVAEFNQALKKANEKWQENWDGLSYPSNIIVVTVENLHNEPCTYRVNLTDADYNSIQDIVDLSPTPMHASIPTEKAIEVLNKAEANAREQGLDDAEQDKTYAYGTVYTVVMLDIGTEERKNAVSEALKSTISKFGENNDMSKPYKNLLEQIKPTAEFLHASSGHLSCLKYTLRYSETNQELCLSLLNSIKRSEKEPKPVIIIKGYDCLPRDTWENLGITYKIGQCVDDMSFYYARATDGTVTRDYEYDHEPSREKVMSDHADKLAEEAIDRHEAEYGADGYRAFPDYEAKAEYIPQQQDISHNTNNAALSAAKTANGQKGSNIMSTKMECTSMFLSEGNTNSKTKAVASITVNDEFVIKGIKMYESSAGNLDIVMPSRKFGNDYQDVVFPITAEAREQMKQAVLDTYVKVVESGLDKLPLEAKDAPEKSASKVTVSINLYQSNDEAKNNVKAVGQVVIDDCIVVSGVTVKHYTKDGVEADFVSMPSFKKMDDFGETTYSEYAHAITKECYAKISNAVLGAYETLQRTEYKGVKLSELGEKADVSTKYGMNSNFAEKLMSELEKNGIAYSAKVCGTTSISVRNTDKAAVDKIEKDLSAALKKEAQKSEKQPDQKVNAPKKNRGH